MLLEMAIGDGAGAPFEYAKTDFVLLNDPLTGYLRHPDPRHTVIPGNYTDDTQMTIGCVWAILSGEPLTDLALANAWLRIYQDDPRDGYARGFKAFLDSTPTGR